VRAAPVTGDAGDKVQRMSDLKAYRPNVAAIIVGPEYPEKTRIFIAERSDIAGVWQFPQGGIDKGESAKEALLRELEEEIGTAKVEVIAKYPEWIAYDFPKHAMKKMKPWKGQKQRYYLVRLKKSAKIRLDTKHPEFCDYKFVEPEHLFDDIAHFKKPVYERVIRYFISEGYL
jgi:putative (di)nucleoside polyphosphate hydrolase